MLVLVGVGIFVGGISVGITSVTARDVVGVSVGNGLAVFVGDIVDAGNSTSVSLIDVGTLI